MGFLEVFKLIAALAALVIAGIGVWRMRRIIRGK